MLNKIQELISQIYEEQKKLRNSEFKALQAQIQPHFLYNSLDSVIWFLRMGKNKDAEKMLTELSTLFKISLSKGREIITIEDELKHIGSYLFISNMIYSKNSLIPLNVTRPCISTRPQTVTAASGRKRHFTCRSPSR